MRALRAPRPCPDALRRTGGSGTAPAAVAQQRRRRQQQQGRARFGMAAAGGGAVPPLAAPGPDWTPTVAGHPLPPVSGPRSAVVQRSTKETKVEVRLDIDGTGRCVASTPVGFLNHMLDQVGGGVRRGRGQGALVLRWGEGAAGASLGWGRGRGGGVAAAPSAPRRAAPRLLTPRPPPLTSRPPPDRVPRAI
jgi:hypothetical protein